MSVAVCLAARSREDDLVPDAIWQRWASSARSAPGAPCAVTIHVLGRDELANVLRRLPCKERYLGVCKLFRLELSQLAASATRLQHHWQLHPAHAAPADARRRPSSLALLHCRTLRSLVDGAGAFDAAYPCVLAAATRLEAIDLAVASRRAARAIAAALPGLQRLDALTLRVTNGAAAAAVVAAAPACGALRALTLHCDGGRLVTLAPLAACAALRRLTLCGASATDPVGGWLGVSLFTHVLATCPDLEHLAISASWHSHPLALGRAGRGGAPPERRGLRSLALHVTQLPEECGPQRRSFGLGTVVAALAHMPELTAFSLSCSPPPFTLCPPFANAERIGAPVYVGGAFAPDNLYELLAALPAWPRLEALCVTVPPFSRDAPPALPALPPTLARLELCALPALLAPEAPGEAPVEAPTPPLMLQCPLLTHFGLRADRAGGALAAPPPCAATVAHLQAWWPHRQALEGLTLAPAGLPPQLLDSLAEHLPAHTALTRLELNLSCAPAAALAAALPRCTALRELKLSGVSPTGAPSLFAALAACPALRALDVSDNCSLVLPALAAALPRFRRLRDLTACRIRPQAFHCGGSDDPPSAAKPAPSDADLDARTLDDLEKGLCACAPGLSRAAYDAHWRSLAAALPRCAALRTLRLSGAAPAAPADARPPAAEALDNTPGMSAVLIGTMRRCPALERVEFEASAGWVLYTVHRFAAAAARLYCACLVALWCAVLAMFLFLHRAEWIVWVMVAVAAAHLPILCVSVECIRAIFGRH